VLTFLKFFRLILLNILVLSFLLLFSEYSARALKSIQSCFNKCDFIYLRNPKKIFREQNHLFNLVTFDPILGYVPSPNIDFLIDEETDPFWHGSRVSTDEFGFRKNDNNVNVTIDSDSEILVAGDSFVFGDQVRNHETWPSCLERSTKAKVYNTGVYGYGTAQALRRIENIIKENDFELSLIILSTLVGHDFMRDQLSFRSGYPRPAVISLPTGELGFASVPNPDVQGSKFAKKNRINLRWYDKAFTFVANYSRILQKFERYGVFDPYFSRITSRIDLEHERSATIEEIVGWTFSRFLEIDYPKIVVLQYAMYIDSETLNEREIVIDKLNELGLVYVDTFSETHESDRDLTSLYSAGHHTPDGNSLVCGLVQDRVVDSGLLMSGS